MLSRGKKNPRAVRNSNLALEKELNSNNNNKKKTQQQLCIQASFLTLYFFFLSLCF